MRLFHPISASYSACRLAVDNLLSGRCLHAGALRAASSESLFLYLRAQFGDIGMIGGLSASPSSRFYTTLHIARSTPSNYVCPASRRVTIRLLVVPVLKVVWRTQHRCDCLRILLSVFFMLTIVHPTVDSSSFARLSVKSFGPVPPRSAFVVARLILRLPHHNTNFPKSYFHPGKFPTLIQPYLRLRFRLPLRLTLSNRRLSLFRSEAFLRSFLRLRALNRRAETIDS